VLPSKPRPEFVETFDGVNVLGRLVARLDPTIAAA